MGPQWGYRASMYLPLCSDVIPSTGATFPVRVAVRGKTLVEMPSRYSALGELLVMCSKGPRHSV